jgi:CheY-like chemotaxis protein
MRVLIVEDHADTADSLDLLLSLQGVEVRIARDGPSALLAAQAFAPRVVLLDLGLPGGLSGWEAARQMKALAQAPFIVAVTGFARDEDRQRSAAAGIDLHWAKPVDPELILTLLRQLRGGG